MLIPKSVFEVTSTFSKTKIENNLFEIRFKSEVTTSDKKNDNVYLLLKDTQEKTKACIFVHGLGMETGSKWDTYLRVVPETIGACYIDLPYQRHRKIEKNLLTSFSDGIFTFNFFRQGTLDIIKTVSILKNLGYKEISVIGISLGSIFSIMSMALDKRIEKGVFILAGGDYSIITWKSPVMYKVREAYKKKKITRESCFKARNLLKPFVESVKESKNPFNIKSNIICLYFDPLCFAPLIDPERVLMINGLFDFIIPRQATLRLHRALGKPKIIWFPTDHLYLYIFKKRIITYIKSFLR
jgi:cephalosporin-C deacetylase-like acetyl esterase